MQATDAFWHLVNCFAPAVCLGGLAAAAVRLVWRRELSRTSLWRLWAWSSGGAALASLGGLLAFQHDGKMATYAAMVLAGAVGLWWSGFARTGR